MKMTLVALLAAATVLPALPSSAATACPLIKDGVGDVTSGGQKVDNGNVDLLSVDLAAGAKQVVAVMRVSKLEPRDPASAPLGDRTYVVSFKYARERTVRFLSAKSFAFTDTTGKLQELRFGHVSSTGQAVLDGTATGSINLATKTLTVSAPLSAWKPAKLATMLRYGTLSGITAVAQTHFVAGDEFGYRVSSDLPEVNTRSLNPLRFTDTATTTKKVVVGFPTCIKAP